MQCTDDEQPMSTGTWEQLSRVSQNEDNPDRSSTASRSLDTPITELSKDSCTRVRVGTFANREERRVR